MNLQHMYDRNEQQEHRFTRSKDAQKHNRSRQTTLLGYQTPQISNLKNKTFQKHEAVTQNNDFADYLKNYYQEVILQNESYKHKVQIYESSIKYLNDRLKTKDSEIVSMKEDLSIKHARMEEYKNESTEASKKYKHYKNMCRNYQLQISTLQSREQTERDMRIDLQKEKNQLCERYQNYQASLSLLQQQLQHEKKAKLSYQEKCKKNEQEIIHLQKQIQSIRKELENVSKRLQQTEEQREREKQINEKRGEYEKIVLEYKQENQNIKFQMRELQSEGKNLASLLNLERNKNQQLERLYQECRKEKNVLSEEIEKLQGSITQHKREKLRLEQDLKTAKQIISRKEKKENYSSNHSEQDLKIIQSECSLDSKRDMNTIPDSSRKIGGIKSKTNHSSSNLAVNKEDDGLEKLIKRFEKIKNKHN